MSTDGGVFNYSVERVRQRMAQFVIQQGLPFNHFDNPRLTSLIRETLQPSYNHVSRTTLRKHCLKMWREAKEQLILGFEKLETGVNLTTDVWSAPHGLPESYLCVTAHWVDPKMWQMMKRTITFEQFGYPHSGENLFEILDEVITTFKLGQKIFSISFDNASNNTSAVRQLKIKYEPICQGVFYHSRCVAHIINLVVQHGLDVPAISKLRDLFKDMLKDVFATSKRRRKDYEKLCRDTGKPTLGPNWDVPTRWNSTWKMFDSALQQRLTLELFHENLVEKGKAAVTFPDFGWGCIEKLTELLEVFKTSTTILSGVYYPTSSLVLKQLYLMCSKLNDFQFGPDVNETMIAPMKAKFKKYFEEMPPAITCAAALNPCLNVAGVEMLIENICYDLGLNDDNPNCSTNLLQTFNRQLQDMFDHYLVKYGNSTNIQQQMHEGASSSRSNPELNFYNNLRNVSSKRSRGSTPSSELGRYQGTDFLATIRPEEFANFDILAWWKDRESQFPVLAAMARDLLSVQASTVASESAFSLSGRILSVRRTRLTPTSLEMCVCLKDHLDAAERIQHLTSLEDQLSIEEPIHAYEVAIEKATPLSDDELALEENV